MTVAIRRASGSPADLATVVAVTNANRPEWSTTVDDLTWADETYPGTVRFLAELEGRAIGLSTVGRIWVHAAEYDAYWATIDVVDGARRQGTGGRLLRSVADVAREARKTYLHVPLNEGRPEAKAFLARRGFEEFERSRISRLELAGMPRPDAVLPPGVILATLAKRPGLVRGVHDVAIETFADIPGGDEPMAVGDLDEFRARDVDRPSIPPDAFMVAVDAATDQVIGYASLIARRPNGIGEHDMTAVRRAWRGRGIATALKLATIRWAIEHELSALETGNDEANQPMQAVNRRLGYARQPDELTMRGSVAAAMMSP